MPRMTLRLGTMRLACMFSSILLFGAAGLLLFISLQDPVELSPQQVPGEPRGGRLPLPVRTRTFLVALVCWAWETTAWVNREGAPTSS